MELVPFEKKHLLELLENSGELSDKDHNVFNVLTEYPNVLESIALCGPTKTITDDDKVVGLAGINDFWEGVGEVWLITLNSVNKKPVRFCRLLMRGLKEALRENYYHRLQASIHADNLTMTKFAKIVGFEEESVMRKYGPDKSDYLRMAKVM
jgi:RimJ/RimL family protein N-acetyltransferase